VADQPANPAASLVVIKFIQLWIALIINLPLLPLHLLGVYIFDRPPIVPRLSQFARYLELCFTADPSDPCRTPRARLYIAILLTTKAVCIPIWGLAWYLDEILYGRHLSKPSNDIVRPIFVISGGRSGSTQITRYIETDPRVEAPNILQCMMPFLWLWRLVEVTLGRVVTPEYVTEKIKSILPPEALERHEMDPFKADTFDATIWSFHFNSRALALGPDIAHQDMNFARINVLDSYLAKDFGRLVDRLGRKHLSFRRLQGRAVCNEPRLFIKGHFLWAGDELENRYPDSTFVTVVRNPAARLQSAINYMRVQPGDPGLGLDPWQWLSSWLRRSEADYCCMEMEWYSKNSSESATRCVVTFDDFKSDLQKCMLKVFKSCDLMSEKDATCLPEYLPRKHPERKRHGYTVNKSLKDLDIDETEIQTELADYIAWCRSHSL